MAKIKCPYCGNVETVPIIYGYPSNELFREAEEGKIHIGGCVVSEDNPRRYCKNCQECFDSIHATAIQVHNLHFFIGGYSGKSYDISINNEHKFICKRSMERYDDFKIIKDKYFNIDQWNSIWEQIQKCYVNNWYEEYLDKDVIDGTNWELFIEILPMNKHNDTKIIRSHGENSYPVYFQRLLKILSNIAGEKIA